MSLPEALDAWEAYHRGLWHMYLFTHFQEAFQGWAPRGPATDQAFACAGRRARQPLGARIAFFGRKALHTASSASR